MSGILVCSLLKLACLHNRRYNNKLAGEVTLALTNEAVSRVDLLSGPTKKGVKSIDFENRNELD